MSRSISQTAKDNIFASRSDEAMIALLTIEHTDLSSTLRVCNAGEDVVSRSNTYTWFPFDINLPADSDEDKPEIRIRIEDPTREITSEVRALTSAPTITLELVLSSSLDTVEAGPFKMLLKNVNWDDLNLSGQLTYEDVLIESYPGDSFTPNEYPGLF